MIKTAHDINIIKLKSWCGTGIYVYSNNWYIYIKNMHSFLGRSTPCIVKIYPCPNSIGYRVNKKFVKKERKNDINYHIIKGSNLGLSHTQLCFENITKHYFSRTHC